MASLTSQQITESGIVPTTTSLGETNTFTNTGKEFIYYTNSSGDSKTITVTTQVTSIDSPIYGDTTKADATQVVADGETAYIGPFAVEAYNDTAQEVTFAITPYDGGSPDSAAILYL